MKILIVTNMYPTEDRPAWGIFVMQQVKQLRRLGHNVDVMNIYGYRSKLNYIKAVFEVFQKTVRNRYDIVHAHYGYSGFPALFRWRTPLVVTLHGSDALFGIFRPFISKCVSRLADAVIVVSKQIASVIPGDVIPCGVDLEIFKPRNQAEARAYLGLPEKRRIILFPFDPSRKIKRYDLARAAIDWLASNGHDIELLVVNGVKNDLMPFYYNAADAMILCSDSEGSPTTVKEALACNIPVICTNVGDMDELARKIPGIYICNKDEEALARKIDYVLCNENNVNFDGYSAMRPYEQGHLAMSIISVYERVLKKGNRNM